MPWTDEITDGATGWAQAQEMANTSQMHLPIPLMTLPSSTPQETGFKEDYVGEGDN